MAGSRQLVLCNHRQVSLANLNGEHTLQEAGLFLWLLNALSCLSDLSTFYADVLEISPLSQRVAVVPGNGLAEYKTQQCEHCEPGAQGGPTLE